MLAVNLNLSKISLRIGITLQLVKLNLNNPEVKEFIFSVAKYWMTEFKIDGWRLDVAYEIQPDFWKNFRNFCKNINPDCFLLGELIYEPYNKYVGPELLDAGTNFQIYKSVWSSFNSNNMHELKAVLERSFHKNWGLYKNIVMVNFLGNHDTTRIRSILTDERGIYPAFIFLFTTLGIPKIYYGDEIGMFGIKKPDSDEDIRKPMPMSETDWPENGKYIFDHVKNLIKIRNQNHALIYGSIDYLYADNNYLAFIRKSSLQTILVIINTINSPEIKKIPLWNQNLDGSKFIELLDQGGKKEYIIQNNHLTAEFFPYWGRILLKID
ncbi:MAG: alpha-amylase family glycosyl hydrolase [Candidatus Helarchaeota archaeon]